MKKRLLSLFLVLVMLIMLAPFAAFAQKSSTEITQQIRDTYSASLKSAGRSSFNGYCGAYVGWQMKVLGITSSYQGFNGNAAYDTYKNSSTSSGGYSIAKYPASSYSLKSALNAISSNGTVNVYNILVGFEQGSGDAGKLYGHVCYIHAIIDGRVYHSESFGCTIGGTKYSEGAPIVSSIDDFCTYYNRWTVLDGLIHFTKPVTVSFNAAGGSCQTSTKVIDSGSAIGTLPTPTRSGYQFVGWYSQESGGERITTSTTFTSNRTVYARWASTSITVNYYDYAGNLWMRETAESGKSYVLTSDYPKSSTFFFAGWAYSVNASKYDLKPGESINPTSTVDLYPVYLTKSIIVSGSPVYIYNISDLTESGSYQVEKKTLYRYRDNTTSTVYGAWSSEQSVKGAASLPSETATFDITSSTKYYNYYHYCCNWYNNKNNVDSISYGSGSHYLHYYTSTSELSATSIGDKGGKTLYGYAACPVDFRVWAKCNQFISYDYKYKTRTTEQVTNPGQWSAWQATEPAAKSNRDIAAEDFYICTEVHAHKYTGKVIAPTCTEKGCTIYTCSCKDEYKDEYVEATGHSYEAIFSWNGTSCTASMYCDSCKTTRPVSCNVTSTETRAATTTSTGIKTYSAYVDFDGHHYESDKHPTEVIPKLDPTSDPEPTPSFFSRFLSFFRSLFSWLPFC